MDYNVVHIDQSFAFVNQIHKFIVYYSLKGRRGVGEAEEHDSGLEKPIACLEGCLPFVTFFDMDIVISPLDTKLGEPFLPEDAVDELGYQWKGIAVGHSPFIEIPVILYWPQFSIFLFDEEEPAGIRRL